MTKYIPGDVATFYFIVKTDDVDNTIKGWTDKKDLAKFYIEFHNCKSYKIRKVTDTIENIHRITEENLHDEIALSNIITRGRHRSEVETIVIPATNSELRFLREESSSFLSGQINYGLLNDIIPYFKNKYRKALDAILLSSIISMTTHNKVDRFNSTIELDQLKLLFRISPDDFE